jgi:hypothetical protein
MESFAPPIEEAIVYCIDIHHSKEKELRAFAGEKEKMRDPKAHTPGKIAQQMKRHFRPTEPSENLPKPRRIRERDPRRH